MKRRGERADPWCTPTVTLRLPDGVEEEDEVLDACRSGYSPCFAGHIVGSTRFLWLRLTKGLLHFLSRDEGNRVFYWREGGKRWVRELFVRDLLEVFSPSLPNGTSVSDGSAVAVFHEAASALLESVNEEIGNLIYR